MTAPRALLALLAALALSLPAAAQPPAVSAGETARNAQSQSAALRNRNDPNIRILVWYPASGAEKPIDIGSPKEVVFRTGSVAPGAPPADGRPHALILLSHGLGGTARQLTWLGAPLARLGYIVVAVDHPGTNGQDGVTPEGAYAPWARADDLSLALDTVLADPVIAPHIDARRIGVAGFSLGGFTGALMAGARPDPDRFLAFCRSAQRDASCERQVEFPVDFEEQAAVLGQPLMRPLAQRAKGEFRDRRVKAAFLIAPALVQGLDPASLKAITIPVEVVAGEADAVAPFATNAKAIADLVPEAVLTPLPGVGHYDFLSLCGPAGAKLPYCVDGPGANRGVTHAAALAQATAFFAAALGGP
jgi:predicted dienelactone hydrolase